MQSDREPGQKSFWRTPIGWAFAGFAAVAAFFIVTEHAAHAFGVLPWLLILACPLMHFFMHGRHGHGGHGDGAAKKPGPRDAAPAPRDE